MGSNSRNSVIDFVGVPWETDLCKFYRTKAVLIDLLVPYFETDLEDNELCILPFNPPEARKTYIIWAYMGLYGLIWAYMGCPRRDTILEVRDITKSKWGEDESEGVLKNCMQQTRSWLASTAHGGKAWMIELKERMNKLCFRLGEHFSGCIKSMRG